MTNICVVISLIPTEWAFEQLHPTKWTFAIQQRNSKHFFSNISQSSSHTQIKPKYWLASLCDQNCGVEWPINRQKGGDMGGQTVRQKSKKNEWP